MSLDGTVGFEYEMEELGDWKSHSKNLKADGFKFAKGGVRDDRKKNRVLKGYYDKGFIAQAVWIPASKEYHIYIKEKPDGSAELNQYKSSVSKFKGMGYRKLSSGSDKTREGNQVKRLIKEGRDALLLNNPIRNEWETWAKPKASTPPPPPAVTPPPPPPPAVTPPPSVTPPPPDTAAIEREKLKKDVANNPFALTFENKDHPTYRSHFGYKNYKKLVERYGVYKKFPKYTSYHFYFMGKRYANISDIKTAVAAKVCSNKPRGVPKPGYGWSCDANGWKQVPYETQEEEITTPDSPVMYEPPTSFDMPALPTTTTTTGGQTVVKPIVPTVEEIVKEKPEPKEKTLTDMWAETDNVVKWGLGGTATAVVALGIIAVVVKSKKKKKVKKSYGYE